MSRPKDTPGVPNHVRWYEFLGAAHDRPYHPDYQPFNWRGWLDFGTGALGDMACHTINIACMALELFDPEIDRGRRHLGHRRPRDLPGLVDHPHPVRPAQRPRPAHPDLVRRRRQTPRETRRIYKETTLRREGPRQRAALGRREGLVLLRRTTTAPSTCCCPEDKFKDVEKPKPTLPRSPGHFTEWVDAIKSGDPDQGDVELRLRRPADRDRAPGRRRAQGRHDDRVGSRGHQGQELSRYRAS